MGIIEKSKDDNLYIIFRGKYSDNRELKEIFNNRDAALEYIALHDDRDGDDIHIVVKKLNTYKPSIKYYTGLKFTLDFDGEIGPIRPIISTNPIEVTCDKSVKRKSILDGVFYERVITIPTDVYCDYYTNKNYKTEENIDIFNYIKKWLNDNKDLIKSF